MYPTVRDDVFQDSPLPIVDCDVLEAAKENVQPLASGRRVTALSAILSTPQAQRESQLSATRHRLRINVEIALTDEDNDADPLEAYCRLVYWTVENYPQGHSAESGLLELLEEATRVLKDDRDGKWRAELKYLKLWVLYASFVEKPVIIYKFLMANEIGTKWALLYEEYAAVLERDGRIKEADQVYNLGIARQADSLTRLQNRHRDFQKRMMSSTAISPLPQPSVTPTTTTRRTALGTSSSTPSLPMSTSTTTHTASNARLSIFVDPSGSTTAESMNAYPDLGTRKTRIKENVPEVKKAGGTTLKQRRVVSASSGPNGGGIMVYRDPEKMPPPPVPVKENAPETPAISRIVPFVGEVPATPRFTPFRDETMTPAGISSPSVSDSVMRLKKKVKGVGEAEALRKDPLKNYGDDGVIG